MNLLLEKTVLVAGGAGGVGEGITRQLLLAGAKVVVPTRSQEKAKELRDRFSDNSNLITIVGNIGDQSDVERVRNTVVKKIGTIDSVVASIGIWSQGAQLTQLPLTLWQSAIENNLTSHFLLARTFLPLIVDRPGSTYTMINGGSALMPFPEAGHISIVASGQIMMKDVLFAEHRDKPVRINTLVLATPIVTRYRQHASANWLTADNVGLYATYLTSKLAEKVNGQTIIFESPFQLPKLV